MFPIIRCQCQQEQYEKEEAKRKHQEFLEHISRLKSSGLQDPALREFTFAHDNGINPEIEKAKNYVTHWEEIKSKAMGLLLWGDVGTGKSFFAGCVANALLDKGVPVLMTNFAKILNSLTGIYPQDRNEFINSLNQYSLLIIGDLGVERNSRICFRTGLPCNRQPLPQYETYDHYNKSDVGRIKTSGRFSTQQDL